MNEEIKKLQKIAEELEFQIIVCNATGTGSANIKYETARRLYDIVKHLEKELKGKKDG